MMMVLFFDQYFLTNSEEVISLYGILKDFIVPSITLILTVLGSFLVFNYSFNKEKSHNKLLQIEENKITLEIVHLTNKTIIRELEETIKIIDKNVVNLNIKKFLKFYQSKFNKELNHSLIEIGFKKIYMLSVVDRKVDKDYFVRYQNSIFQLPGHLSTIETYDQYIFDAYNRLNTEINKKMHEILVKTSNYIHEHIPPFETVRIDEDYLNSTPPLKLASILLGFYQDFKDLDSELSMLEKTNSFLLNLNTIKEHPIASKAIDSAYAQEIVYALNIIENFSALFNAGKESYKNYLIALNKIKIDVENYQTELNKEIN